MTTALDTMTAITTAARASAAHVATAGKATPLCHRSCPIGKAIRQGDVYLRRIDPATQRGARRKAQLVDGTTVGARHVARNPAQVYEPAPGYEPASLRTRLGDIVPLVAAIVVSPRRICITHPEHADHELPAGTYEVLRQLDTSTNRAVVD